MLNAALAHLSSVLLFLSLASTSSAQVVISEIMAVSGESHFDEDGTASDWLEVHNAGASLVNLDGWYLTDNPTALNKWRFPTVDLAPGRFLTVFCSGKHRQDPESPLHTNFNLDGAGEFVALVRPDFQIEDQIAPFFPQQFRDRSCGLPQEVTTESVVRPGSPARFFVPTDDSLGSDWTAADFDDSDAAGWTEGTVGLGYDSRPEGEDVFRSFIETDIADFMEGVNSSVYVRIEFDLNDAPSFQFARLHMRYDDGFIAYLNGTRVAIGNAPEDASWDGRATGDHFDANSIEIETFDVSADSSALRNGKNVLALHGLNTSRFNRDFFLQPEFVLISAEPIEQGRRQFLTTPTPNLPNSRGFDRVSPDPEFSHPEGVFGEDFDLELIDPTGQAEIRFTLDGSPPTETATLYESPIPITGSTEVRVILTEPGKAPSRPITRRYARLESGLRDFSSNLPVFVLHTMGQTIDEFRFTPTLLQLLEPGEDGRTRLDRNATFTGKGALRIRGSSTSRPLSAKPPFAFEIRDEEEEDLAVSLLGMPADSDWILYPPFNQDRALIRNALIYELSNQMGTYAVRTRFVEVFRTLDDSAIANFHYQGVYLLMEKIKRGPHRVDVERLRGTDNVEPNVTGGYMLKIDRRDPGARGFETARGTPPTTDAQNFFVFVTPEESELTAAQRQWILDHLDELEAVLYGPGFTDPLEGYAKYLDVDAFIDHHILVELGKNPDGLRLSTYFYKTRGGKLAAGPVWDYDRAMAPTLDGRARDPIGFYQHTGYIWWGRMREDPAYEERYFQRWRELRRGPLSTANILAVIESMAEELAEAQVRNYQRFPSTVGELGWQHEIDRLKDWLETRALWLDYQRMLPPVFSAATRQVDTPFMVELSNPNDIGEVVYSINGPDPRGDDGNPIPETIVGTGPIEIFENTAIRSRVRIDNALQGGHAWSDLEERFFVTTPTPLAITEIMFDPIGGFDYEFIELQNYGEEPIALEGIAFTGGVIFSFTAEHGVLQPGEFGVVVNDTDGFAERYPSESEGTVRVFGEFQGGLRDTGEELTLSGNVGESVAVFEYFGNWYPETAAGHSLVLVNARSHPDTWSQAAAWRPSALADGSPGREDVPVQLGQQVSGDSNQDGRLNMSDALHLLLRLFQHGGGPWPCGDGTVEHAANLDVLDANRDEKIDASDAVWVLEYLFREGVAPAGGVRCRQAIGCPTVCR